MSNILLVVRLVLEVIYYAPSSVEGTPPKQKAHPVSTGGTEVEQRTSRCPQCCVEWEECFLHRQCRYLPSIPS